MNEHILFVIDHLANPDKYSKEELKANAAAADAVGWAAVYAAAADCDGSRAAYWAAEYFKLTGEDKQTYIDKLKGES
jgi:hypothetical protein